MLNPSHTPGLRLVMACLLLVWLSAPVLAGEQTPTPTRLEGQVLHARTGRPVAAIDVMQDPHGALVTVTGGMGIGHATIRRLDTHWPDTVLIRLHLMGLETLRVTSDEQTVTWAVPSTAPELTLMSTSRDGKRVKLQPADTDFVPVKLVANRATVPLVDGYFEVALPAWLLAHNPPSLRLHWVDFYRG